MRTDGSDSNDGSANTAGSAFLTIQKGHNASSAGDTVSVADGTYNERVNLTNSGTSTALINYIGNASGTGVVSYGFVFWSASNIRIIGMEIRHTSTTYQKAIEFRGAMTNVHIIDNYIHDNHWAAISAATSSSASSIFIRGNRIDYVCHPGSLQTGDGAIIGNYTGGNTHQWVVEYNHISRSGDYLNLYGSNSIARNNFLHDTKTEYWITNSPNSMHFDGIQSGSDGGQIYCRNQLYEANIIGDIFDRDGLNAGTPDHNGHMGIWQDNSGYGDTNILVRRNVGFRFASGALAFLGTDGGRFQNNTIHQVAVDGAGGCFTFYGGGGSTGGWVVNNIISSNGLVSDAISVDSPSHTVTVTNNLGFISNTESSYVSTNDPQFANSSGMDFKIGSSSPAKDTGTTNYCYITSGSGSGTSFDVNDGGFLRDGDGLVEGDRVTIGGTTTRVMDVTANTVTVSNSVSWTTGDAVFLGTDTTPDIGAIPNSATYLTAATYTLSGSTYTVTPVGDARGVWFYSNSIPIVWDYDAPYQTDIPSGTVTIKAYAIWPQTNMVVAATYAGSGDATPAVGREKRFRGLRIR